MDFRTSKYWATVVGHFWQSTIFYLGRLGSRWPALHDVAPIIGAIITATATIAVGVVVSYRLTTGIKRTEFFIAFNKRFQEITDAQHTFNTNVLAARDQYAAAGGLEREAFYIYRQYFNLLFDEFHAYSIGFIDPEIFEMWMMFCAIDNRGTGSERFELEGVSYIDALRRYLNQPHIEGGKFARFMSSIHKCKSAAEVRRLVRRQPHRAR